jgi:cytochrome c oxidase subunit 2
MAQAGYALYEKYQCVSCHSSDAVKRGRGPSLAGIYGKPRQLTNGKTVTADDAYLRNVLYYPEEWALVGWPQGMPSYKGVLTEEQVLQINAYVKSLSVTPKAETPQTTGTADAPAAGTESVGMDAGSPNPDSPAANTDNQQWRYMYGGEQYK